jgi:predicted metal-dependent HD superfamily phosphohydrolase
MPGARLAAVTDAALDRELRARWAADIGTGAAADEAFRALVARHAEPHRRYHTARHVAHVLRSVQRLAEPAGVAEAAARTVRLAAWYHDAIYDPRAAATQNERASAALARRALAPLGEPEAVVAEVERLVLLTACHEPAADDRTGQLLVDADLDVLAAEPAAYDAYRRGVRTEYAHVENDAWRAGRAAFLRGMIERPRLFVLDVEPDREQRARANLAAELADLGGSVGSP